MSRKIFFYIIPGNECIQYGNSLSIPISQTSFPFENNRFKKGILWKMEIIHYDAELRKVVLKVVDYFSDDQEAFENQKPQTQLNRIDFEKFEWRHLEHCLYAFKFIDLKPYLVEENPFRDYETEPPKNRLFRPTEYPKQKWEKAKSLPKEVESVVEEEEGIVNPPFSRSNEIEPKWETVVIEFPIKNIRFESGKGIFKIMPRYFHGFDKSVEGEIMNPAIREEYQAITNYIEKALKRKKIEVTMKIRRYGWGEYELDQLESEEFMLISDQLIESAKFSFISDRIFRPKIREGDQVVVEPDQLFEAVSGLDDGQQLDEEHFFEHLLQDKPSLHYKELQWLSRKQSLKKGMRLKFVLNPDFAFLFYIETPYYAFFILETYKVDLATYIWKYSRRGLLRQNEQKWIAERYREIEEELLRIIESGRHSYRSKKPEHFAFIDHSNDEGGFEKWKNEVETILET